MGTGGDVDIRSGKSTPKSSGAVSIRTQNAGDSGVSGALTFATGTTSNGDSGDIAISSGSAASGKGGSISVTVGQSSVGPGGSITMNGGQTSANSQSGGSVSLTGGQSTGSGSSGGGIYLTGGQSSSGAGGSIIIKPGAGSSSGSTYIQTHAGTTQMTISNSGVTVSATLTAQSTVYAVGGFYVGTSSNKALISNILRGSYTIPGCTGVADPSTGQKQQTIIAPGSNWGSMNGRVIFNGWPTGASTLKLRLFNAATDGTSASIASKTFYWVVIQYS